MRYTRSPPCGLSDTMVRPSFFLKVPAKVPRTVCACQPVAVQIWPMVAPSGRCSIRITSACLLLSRVRGLACAGAGVHVASAVATACSSSASTSGIGGVTSGRFMPSAS
uniref:Uncharacterized protein n=1 Tax=Siphoviridae sp. ct86u1 TaxID=2827789 RepID=A0A8S5T6M0_9CAUD|nr:MAG TPA: hypothetical protein [Siphoviridae sp. ct86u1]